MHNVIVCIFKISKCNKGPFTYYVISQGGGGGIEMIMLDYVINSKPPGGFASDYVIKIFILIEHLNLELEFFYINTKFNTKILFCNIKMI